MISRATLFDMKLPYPLGEMLKNAFIYSHYEMGYESDRIYEMLHNEDVSRRIDDTRSHIIMSQIEWCSTKEGHMFWSNIHDKLKQIEEQ
jgi:hypothetical protein